MSYADESVPRHPGLNRRGLVFLVSGPSGVGKSTVVKRVLEVVPDLVKLVTTTSRPRRSEEEDGVHYYFVSKETFMKMVEQLEFIEWKNHFDHYYGLTWSTLHKHSEQDVIFDVDTKGKKDIIEQIPVITMFMRPPSLNDLRSRLASRADLSEEELRQRLNKANEELKSAYEYHYTVENVDVDQTVETMCAIIEGERLKRDVGDNGGR